MVKHRDEMTDEEMAEYIGAPVALVTWARKKDPDIEPPPLDDRYDRAFQESIVAQVRRANSPWGLGDELLRRKM